MIHWDLAYENPGAGERSRLGFSAGRPIRLIETLQNPESLESLASLDRP